MGTEDYGSLWLNLILDHESSYSLVKLPVNMAQLIWLPLPPEKLLLRIITYQLGPR